LGIIWSRTRYSNEYSSRPPHNCYPEAGEINKQRTQGYRPTNSYTLRCFASSLERSSYPLCQKPLVDPCFDIDPFVSPKVHVSNDFSQLRPIHRLPLGKHCPYTTIQVHLTCPSIVGSAKLGKRPLRISLISAICYPGRRYLKHNIGVAHHERLQATSCRSSRSLSRKEYFLAICW
jgi:hypothetical protein